MTNRQNDAPPPDGLAKNTGDYDVGYGKPPVAHRFKPGNKANPKGRYKGARNPKVVIREVLFETVTVREGGEIKQMSALEAMLKKLVSKGLGGDHKAILAVIGLAQKEGLLTPEQEQVVEDLSESDLEILEDVKRRLEGPALDNLPEDPVSELMNPEALGQSEPVAP